MQVSVNGLIKNEDGMPILMDVVGSFASPAQVGIFTKRQAEYSHMSQKLRDQQRLVDQLNNAMIEFKKGIKIKVGGKLGTYDYNKERKRLRGYEKALEKTVYDMEKAKEIILADIPGETLTEKEENIQAGNLGEYITKKLQEA